MTILSCPICYISYRMNEIDNQLQKLIKDEKLVLNDFFKPVAINPKTMS